LIAISEQTSIGIELNGKSSAGKKTTTDLRKQESCYIHGRRVLGFLTYLPVFRSSIHSWGFYLERTFNQRDPKVRDKLSMHLLRFSSFLTKIKDFK
jgi:hypothetical protein